MEDINCQDVSVFISSLEQHVSIGQLLCDNIILCPRHPAMDKTEVIPFLVKFSGKPTNENTSAYTVNSPGSWELYLPLKKKQASSQHQNESGRVTKGQDFSKHIETALTLSIL